ncbi:MAG TPA: choice-of-anchor Q domain-containing protein, partial [Aggregatilineales bacterium]|nr:choice-of-anchor Q domain-containing protein [Aggregatilineales bacterium]
IISGAGQCGGTVNIDNTSLADSAGCDFASVVTNLFLGAFDGTTVALGATSPARDNYTAPCTVANDQLGTARPVGIGCDVGALEAPAVGNIP